MQKLLTIVVPVYKVESYINKCLDSLVLGEEKLMDQLEVLVVNDGTPDRSAEMSREYVKRFPNTFRQIDKENGGHGSAWNVGLKEATGKYLRFLDSDDWLSNLDRLMLDLQDCDADVVFHPYEICNMTNHATATAMPTDLPADRLGATLPLTEDVGNLDGNKYGRFNFWGVTYKTEILKPLHPLFAEKAMYDDFILSWALMIHGRTCVTFDYTVYNYLVGRPGNSMSETEMRKRAISYKKCFEQYEKVRQGIDEKEIPPGLLVCIDKVIASYADFIFWHELFLPYGEARKQLAHLYGRYLRAWEQTPMLKRYARLPFPLFYWVERFWLRKIWYWLKRGSALAWHGVVLGVKGILPSRLYQWVHRRLKGEGE